MTNKLIIGVLMSPIIWSHAVPPAPGDMANLLQEECNTKITSVFDSLDVRKLSPSQKLQLTELFYPYCLFKDLMQAKNREGILGFPYAQVLCPVNRREELRQRGAKIGPFRADRLHTMISPSCALLDLSGGSMRAPATTDWKTWISSPEYCELFDDMGPLAEIYLEAREHPNILPVMSKRAVTFAYPMDISPYKINNETGELVLNEITRERIPNEVFFIEWNKRIQVKFTSDTAITQALGSIMEILPLKEETDAILSNLRKGQLSNSSQCTVLFNLLDRLSRGREFFLHFAPLFLTR